MKIEASFIESNQPILGYYTRTSASFQFSNQSLKTCWDSRQQVSTWKNNYKVCRLFYNSLDNITNIGMVWIQ
jgi:hypothetical protein